MRRDLLPGQRLFHIEQRRRQMGRAVGVRALGMDQEGARHIGIEIFRDAGAVRGQRPEHAGTGAAGAGADFQNAQRAIRRCRQPRRDEGRSRPGQPVAEPRGHRIIFIDALDQPHATLREHHGGRLHPPDQDVRQGAQGRPGQIDAGGQRLVLPVCRREALPIRSRFRRSRCQQRQGGLPPAPQLRHHIRFRQSVEHGAQHRRDLPFQQIIAAFQRCAARRAVHHGGGDRRLDRMGRAGNPETLAREGIGRQRDDAPARHARPVDILPLGPERERLADPSLGQPARRQFPRLRCIQQPGQCGTVGLGIAFMQARMILPPVQPGVQAYGQLLKRGGLNGEAAVQRLPPDLQRVGNIGQRRYRAAAYRRNRAGKLPQRRRRSEAGRVERLSEAILGPAL